MIVHPAEQGTSEWIKAKLGIASSSNAYKMITPARFAPTKPEAMAKYAGRLLMESVVGAPTDETQTEWMKRGTAQEPHAIEWYELERSVDVQRVGFCTLDDGSFGFSPDGLVDEDGGVEIKVPSLENHGWYWISPSALYEKGGQGHWKVQVQACLWASGRKWWDLVSFNSKAEPVVVRVEPDPKFQEAFAPIVSDFAKQLAAHRERYDELFKHNPFL